MCYVQALGNQAFGSGVSLLCGAAYLTQVLSDDPKIEWGRNWHELQQATEFAQWYNSVEHWHRASAEQLRVGVGGVAHLQQRVQRLTVMLAETEQALSSTQRLRQQSAKEQEEALNELQEEQEAQLEAVKLEKEELCNTLKALQHQLDQALEEKQQALQEAKGEMQELERAMQEKAEEELRTVREELQVTRNIYEVENDKLTRELNDAMAKRQHILEEKTQMERQVQRLQTELEQAKARGAWGRPRQERQGEERQGKARRGEARQGKRQGKARQGKARRACLSSSKSDEALAFFASGFQDPTASSNGCPPVDSRTRQQRQSKSRLFTSGFQDPPAPKLE